MAGPAAGPGSDGPADLAAFFAGEQAGPLVCAAVEAVLAGLGGYQRRISRSQVGYRRRRGFAWVWRPGRWLAHPRTPLVLTMAFGEPLASPRFSAVAHPSPRVWVHHIDVTGPADIDPEVADWLARAYDEAG